MTDQPTTLEAVLDEFGKNLATAARLAGACIVAGLAPEPTDPTEGTAA